MSQKVLIIDKNSSDSVSSQLLSSAGYSVDVTRDFDKCVHRFNRKSPDVIIVKEMPESESWYLCAQIRRVTSMHLIVISYSNSKEPW